MKRLSLKTRLFIWYGGSLLLIAMFFWFGVHVLAIKYGTEIFIVLLFLLSLVGFILIQRLTNSLSTLTYKIQKISSKNLNERILGITSDDEVGQLARSFNELLNRLEASFKRERQFIGDVAHELKTPLATMKSSIEVALGRDRPKEEYKQILMECLEDLNNMSSTLIDVLDLAWTEAHINKVFNQKVSLSSLIQEISEIAIKLAQSQKIKVTFNIADDVYVKGDRDKLARAVLNLIDNSIKYNKKGGSVDVKLTSKKNEAILMITDTGKGIPKEDIPQIFDRFYRGSSTGKIAGSGLGLAIVKSIIHMHKGKVDVKSVHGRSTNFVVTLPLA